MGEKKAPEAVTEKNSALYEVARYLAIALFHTLMPVKCYNRERLDAEAPYVLIANHQHALDPVAMAMYIPGRQIVFLGKKELGKGKLAERLLARVHCILVDRHNTDMEAMRACMKALKMGKVLVIFPEGTRHHEGQMEQIENGTSLMVLRSGVPLIPVYLDRPMKFFRRSNAYVGDPIPYEDLREQGVNRESSEALNERMRETYRRMVSEYGSFS